MAIGAAADGGRGGGEGSDANGGEHGGGTPDFLHPILICLGNIKCKKLIQNKVNACILRLLSFDMLLELIF